MATGLAVSRLINVSVDLAPLGAQFANVDSLLIVGDSTVIDVVERIRDYDSLAAVATDFGTSAPEYLAAELFFSQNPAPTQLYIGRWAYAATPGILHGGVLSAAEQVLTNFTAVTSGGLTIVIDGTSHNVTGLDFASPSPDNLNGIASILQAGLPSGVHVYWNANIGRFDIVSSTTGTSSSVAFATAPGSGTSIVDIFGLGSTDGGSTVAGIAAETPLAAVTIMDDMNISWYGLTFATPDITDSQQLAVAGYIQAAFHIFGISTTEASAVNPESSSDIGSLCMTAGYTRTFCSYSSSNPYTAASIFGREFTVNFQGNNTVIDLMYKQEPGVVAENLTASQADTLDAKRYNYFVNYNNNTAIIENGWMSGPAYIDEIHGTDAYANELQVNIYNLLYTNPTKVPQTDAGIHQIVAICEATSAAFVANGLLAPGTWTTSGFGSLNQGDFMPKGYYVYAPPVALQSQADRAARKSPTIQIAAKLAGAVNTVDVVVNVNR
jgi:hypothetical protein